MIAASNIAWNSDADDEMYAFLMSAGCQGIEIAPTRIFPEAPYDHLSDVREFAASLRENYNLCICSMQSIWYGVTDLIFDSDAARERLIAYTAKAVAFASACGCKNLVFGSPKNRSLPNNQAIPDEGYRFFSDIGHIATENGCIIALEANPEIYGTNFINTTEQAFAFANTVNSPGLKVNLDIGTVIFECEGMSTEGIADDKHSAKIIESIRNNFDMINHVHLSEPRLVPIKKRDLVIRIFKVLGSMGYSKYLSLEMANTNRLTDVQEALKLLKEMAGII